MFLFIGRSLQGVYKYWRLFFTRLCRWKFFLWHFNEIVRTLSKLLYVYFYKKNKNKTVIYFLYQLCFPYKRDSPFLADCRNETVALIFPLCSTSLATNVICPNKQRIHFSFADSHLLSLSRARRKSRQIIPMLFGRPKPERTITSESGKLGR